MPACPSCAAFVPDAAAWCGQCFTRLGAATPVAVNRFALAPAAAAPAAAPPVAWTAPPSAWTAPPPATTRPPAATTPPPAVRETRRVVWLVGLAIALGGLLQIGFWRLDRDNHLAPEALVRYSLVATIAFYVVVGFLVLAYVSRGVRLRWCVGPPPVAVAVGLAVGGGLGVVLLALVSAAAGQLSPDPRMVLIVSEGDPAHILAALLIGCIAAPLVEETLFRGLLLESLRTRGIRAALVLSALAFAVWHFNATALRYYVLMGLFLGFLYTRRGLAGSMSAHAAFNGVLTAAAIYLAITPAHQVTADGVSISAPHGWHSMTVPAIASNVVMALKGPSGAELVIETFPNPLGVGPDAIASRLRSGDAAEVGPGVTLQGDTTRIVQLPAGAAVEAEVTAGGDSGVVTILPTTGRSYVVVFDSGGSAQADAGFTRMLNSLQVPAG